MMTESTIQTMLPSQTLADEYNGVSCTLECAYFDEDANLVKPYSLYEGARYKFAIQPTTLWCFRKQVGVKWYIRQVRMEGDSSPVVVEEDEWSL